MTFTEEFIPGSAASMVDGPSYPKAFGITLTPVIAGVGLGVAGLLGAFYLWSSVIGPAQEQNAQLQVTVADQETQIASLNKKLKERGTIEARLKTAEARKTRVMGLFAQEKSLDTLLYDISKLTPKPRSKTEKDQDLPPQLTLKAFTPVSPVEVVQDGSLGELVNGKLKRQTFDVQLAGGYDDTQTFIRELERFQPLLQITDLASTAEAPTTKVSAGPRGLSIKADQNPDLTTAFKLNVLMSRDPSDLAAEQAAAAAAAAAAAPATPPAQ